MLKNYRFPGNVRELKNIIERALIESGGGTITPGHLHFQTDPVASTAAPEASLIGEVMSSGVDYTQAIDGFRRRLIEEALRASEGNRSQAARRLGMDRSNLRNLMKRLAIKA